MGYTLQALIGNADDAAKAAPIGATVIRLSQSMALVPLSDEICTNCNIPFLPLTDEGLKDVPVSIYALAAKAHKIAYIEAMYFGGEGDQAAAIWEDGRLLFGPIVSNDAINQALRMLGVTRNTNIDEFEAMDLGKFRDTGDWR